jgi:hypothetical protein
VSYAIGPTFEANKIGVRRAYTLGRFSGLGTAPDPDTINELVANGYNPADVNSAVALGATNEQLLALPFPADPQTEANAIQSLIQQLSGLQAPPGLPSTSSPSFPQSAIPTTVSTGFGIYDLATKAGWDAAASAINTTMQLVRQAAALNPQDPSVVSTVNQFNSAVADFSNYYATVVGQLPPVSQITLSGLGDVSVGQALWNVLGPSGGLLNVIYQIYLWARNYIATNQTIKQTTATASAATATQGSASMLLQQASSLVAQANALPPAQSAQAAQLRAQAATLQTQASSLLALPLATSTPQSVPLSTWFTQNWVSVAAVLVAVAVLPNLVKKL